MEEFPISGQNKRGFFQYLCLLIYHYVYQDTKKNLKYQKMRKVDAGADEWSCRAVFAFLVSAENDFVQIGNYLERLTRDEQH